MAKQNLNVPPANWLYEQESLGVDVLHHQADLIAVAGKHDPRGRLRPAGREAAGEQVAV